MRPSSRFPRVVSLLLGVWFAVFAAEPAALHVCAVHDATAPASHTGHHSNPHSSHHCTCPGACCPAVGARLGTPPVVQWALVVAFVEPVHAPARVVRPAAPRLVLPPAIGPPRVG